MKKNTIGFHPSNAIKNIMAKYGTYGYIHNDGILLLEKKEIKVSKDTFTTVDVWHVIPCYTKIRVKNYDHSWGHTADQVNCLVMLDLRVIANGFDYVEVLFNAGSIGLTSEKNLRVTQVKFSLGHQTWYETSIPEYFGSRITIQPDPYDKWSPRLEDVHGSIAWVTKEYGKTILMHGELLVEEEQNLLVDHTIE